jgi:hypothetical protein
MSPVLIFFLLASVVACGVLFMWGSNAQTTRQKALDRAQDLEKRLSGAQEDLAGTRDDLRKKAALLEEARERAQKAKKRERSEKLLPEAVSQAPDQAALAPFAAAVEVAERRAAVAERDADTRAQAAASQARQEKQKEIDELCGRLARAEEQLTGAPKPTPGEKMGGVIPGARIDLNTVAPEVVDELRRFFKRAQNAEKLQLVTDGQLEVARDKSEELQRRYFAVCRELALVAVNQGKPQDIADAEAARLAMDIVKASEDASHRRSTMRAARHATRHERPPRERPSPDAGAEQRAAQARKEGLEDPNRRRRHRPFRRHPRRETAAALQKDTDTSPEPRASLAGASPPAAVHQNAPSEGVSSVRVPVQE